MKEQTYFSKILRIGGGSEHLLRMPTILGLKNPDGSYVYKSLDPNKDESVRLEAIGAYEKLLVQAKERFNPEKENNNDDNLKDILWQFMFATNNRFIYFAIEDTTRVSDAMQRLIMNIIEVPHSEDRGLRESKSHLLNDLAYMATYDYCKNGAQRDDKTPNERALKLIRAILEHDPPLKLLIENSAVLEGFEINSRHAVPEGHLQPSTLTM